MRADRCLLLSAILDVLFRGELKRKVAEGCVRFRHPTIYPRRTKPGLQARHLEGSGRETVFGAVCTMVGTVRRIVELHHAEQLGQFNPPVRC